MATWSAHQPDDVAALFEEDMLGDDVEAWMHESSMLRRTFRNVAVISGLIERHHPGADKNRRQVTVNSDLSLRTCCAATSRTTSCCARRARTPPPGSPTSAASPAAAGAHRAGRVTHMALSRRSRRSPCPCCWRSAARACAPAPDEDLLLAEAEAIIAEATTDAEPPPFQLETERVHPLNRANMARQKKQEQEQARVPRRRQVSGSGAAFGRPAMIAAPVHLSGERLMLDPRRRDVLAGARPARGLRPAPGEGHVLRRPRLAACRRGDTHVTLERLAALLHRWRPRVVVALGDSFHDRHGAGRLSGRRPSPASPR